MRQRGILLVNLGSPASTSIADVRRYLGEFLMDPYVIDSPWLVRKIIVSGFILPFRPKRTAHAYQRIWGPEGSPLLQLFAGTARRLGRTHRSTSGTRDALWPARHRRRSATTGRCRRRRDSADHAVSASRGFHAHDHDRGHPTAPRSTECERRPAVDATVFRRSRLSRCAGEIDRTYDARRFAASAVQLPRPTGTPHHARGSNRTTLPESRRLLQARIACTRDLLPPPGVRNLACVSRHGWA